MRTNKHFYVHVHIFSYILPSLKYARATLCRSEAFYVPHSGALSLSVGTVIVIAICSCCCCSCRFSIYDFIVLHINSNQNVLQSNGIINIIIKSHTTATQFIPLACTFASNGFAAFKLSL